MQKLYGTEKKDVLISFGPSICGKCYEVGNDLIPEFKRILDDKAIASELHVAKNSVRAYLTRARRELKDELKKGGII